MVSGEVLDCVVICYRSMQIPPRLFTQLSERRRPSNEERIDGVLRSPAGESRVDIWAFEKMSG